MLSPFPPRKAGPPFGKHGFLPSVIRVSNMNGPLKAIFVNSLLFFLLFNSSARGLYLRFQEPVSWVAHLSICISASILLHSSEVFILQNQVEVELSIFEIFVRLFFTYAMNFSQH